MATGHGNKRNKIPFTKQREHSCSKSNSVSEINNHLIVINSIYYPLLCSICFNINIFLKMNHFPKNIL